MSIDMKLIKAFISLAGGFISYIFGGYDLLLRTMLSLTVIDYITGIGSALYKGKFKASICARGIVKKVFLYITVALAVIIQNFMGEAIPIREVVIVFYIVSEGFSCLENIGKVVKYPPALKKIFAQLQEKTNE